MQNKITTQLIEGINKLMENKFISLFVKISNYISFCILLYGLNYSIMTWYVITNIMHKVTFSVSLFYFSSFLGQMVGIYIFIRVFILKNLVL